jgi:hypothetical protein
MEVGADQHAQADLAQVTAVLLVMAPARQAGRGASIDVGEEVGAVIPIFDSLKRCTPDLQRLAKTPNGLGTTFSVSGVFGSCLVPQRWRQGHSRRRERFMRLSEHLTAQNETLALKQGLDFLEVL